MANLPESSTFDAGVYQLETTDPVIGGPSGVSNTPLKNLANRTKYLKDHVDAIEANFAPKASPALTGTPTAPTAAAGTNTTQIATTAFVQAEIAADLTANLASTAPVMDGTAAVGTSTRSARADHVHPTDTTRAPLASPAFTGTPTAPTPTAGDNTTKLATTAFVKTAVDASKSNDAGLVAYFGATTPPTGWLKANGAAVSRAAYPALFAAIGTTFGGGDGFTTFNLPDLRGEFIRGWDDARGVDSGRGFGTWQGDELRSHRHDWRVELDRSSGAMGNAVYGDEPNYGSALFQTSFTGGNETRPRNIALLACIKFA